MKRVIHRGISRRLNDKGFSLVELLISIAVLVIIMVPLMNNFIRSMQMNRKAEALETESNIAADIMEGLKNLNMKDTLEQFTGALGDFTILTNASGNPNAGEITRLQFNTETGTYEKVNLKDEQATYYFAIHGIQVGSTAYDVFIKMDSDAYKSNPGTMNDYPMPDLINLDEKANGLLQSEVADDTDATVYSAFQERGKDYANKLYEQSPEYLQYLADYDKWKNDCENAEIAGTPKPPEPVKPELSSSDERYKQYLDPGNVKSLITKTMNITVNNDTIEYQVEYRCNWTADDVDKSMIYPVSATKYPETIQNIYLFYTTSDFYAGALHPDVINIVNQDTEKPVNFYVANQSTGIIAGPSITINRISNDDKFSVFTNLPNGNVMVNIAGFEENDGIDYNLIKTEKIDRLYDVTINICKYAAGEPKDKYKDVLYSLKSTRED